MNETTLSLSQNSWSGQRLSTFFEFVDTTTATVTLVSTTATVTLEPILDAALLPPALHMCHVCLYALEVVPWFLASLLFLSMPWYFIVLLNMSSNVLLLAALAAEMPLSQWLRSPPMVCAPGSFWGL